MKKLIQTLSIIVGVGASLGSMAQNVTTPSGSPLIIGNNGVRLANIAASTTTASNPGSGVLSVAANGDLIYVPAGSSTIIQNGTNIYGGTGSGAALSGGGDNIFVGNQTGNLNTTGSDNVFLGSSAGKKNTTGIFNLFLGRSAGENNTTGVYNTFIGGQAGFNNTTGRDNLFLGLNAGLSNTAGDDNVFIGTGAGQSNVSGIFNLFMGRSAGGNTTTGPYNTFVGGQAGVANTTGRENVFMGLNAGSVNTTGLKNTYLGAYSGSNVGNIDNATAIGADAIVTQSNSVVLGNNANVGIGISAPQNKLHINKAGVSGLRLQGLAGLGGTNKALSVDANGDVIVVNNAARLADTEIKDLIKESIKETSFSDANWKMINNNVVNTNVGGVVIGNEITATPAGYKMFVSDGILTERVTVAVKNSEEWADYVFKPTYQLKPLAEVESFIKANKHLPGIPSAQEMVQKGNDLHQTDVKLLQKVEELTLYMIEMEKRLVKAEAENAKMKKALKTRK
jgi:trimeric autotransporter adhesin